LTLNAADTADDMAVLAKGGRTNVMGFFIRLIARIPFLLVAGQWYGATQMGRLAFAVAIVEFAAQITTLGLRRGLALHMTGDGKENGAWDAVLVVLGATLIPTIGLMLFPQLMFPNTLVKPLDYLLPLTIPAIALSDVMLAALAYRMNIAATVRARAVIEPWTISIAAIAFWWVAPSDGLLVAYALSMLAALIASIIPFLKEYGLPKEWSPRAGSLYALAQRNAPLVAADAIEWGTRRLDILILALFVSPGTVGIYWIAQQIASLPQKLKSSFDPVLGPVITKKLAENDRPAVAAQIRQVGFWILAAQLGVGLALGLPSYALLGALGPGSVFVGGTTILALLLAAEVAASASMVSEAALVYVARFKNLIISLVMIGLQAALSLAFIWVLKERGHDELVQAAGVGAALMIALGLSSICKALLATKLLGAPVSIWRWPLILAATGAVLIGQLVILLPELLALFVGIPAILGVYGWIIWTWGFREDDRLLFQNNGG
jgi:O-antigen/teichoic acid export membrane protein